MALYRKLRSVSSSGGICNVNNTRSQKPFAIKFCMYVFSQQGYGWVLITEFQLRLQ